MQAQWRALHASIGLYIAGMAAISLRAGPEINNWASRRLPCPRTDPLKLYKSLLRHPSCGVIYFFIGQKSIGMSPPS
jgi:hypothetical protein